MNSSHLRTAQSASSPRSCSAFGGFAKRRRNDGCHSPEEPVIVKTHPDFMLAGISAQWSNRCNVFMTREPVQGNHIDRFRPTGTRFVSCNRAVCPSRRAS